MHGCVQQKRMDARGAGETPPGTVVVLDQFEELFQHQLNLPQFQKLVEELSEAIMTAVAEERSVIAGLSSASAVIPHQSLGALAPTAADLPQNATAAAPAAPEQPEADASLVIGRTLAELSSSAIRMVEMTSAITEAQSTASNGRP